MNKQIEIFEGADLGQLQHQVNDYLKQDGIRGAEVEIQLSTYVMLDVVYFIIMVIDE